MKFKHVVIQSLAAVEPPIRVTSKEIEEKLKPVLERLGVRDIEHWARKVVRPSSDRSRPAVSIASKSVILTPRMNCMVNTLGVDSPE